MSSTITLVDVSKLTIEDLWRFWNEPLTNHPIWNCSKYVVGETNLGTVDKHAITFWQSRQRVYFVTPEAFEIDYKIIHGHERYE